jgi:hypothetical protein
VANAGDTDGDGFDELLISQEAKESGQMLPRVRLFKLDASTRTLVPRGAIPERIRDAGLGRGMGSAGDVNGDGFGDVLIAENNAPDLQWARAGSCSFWAHGTGRAALRSGACGWTAGRVGWGRTCDSLAM